MKVKASVKRLCSACQLIRRRRRLVVRCPANRKHNQRQGLHTLAPPPGQIAFLTGLLPR